MQKNYFLYPKMIISNQDEIKFFKAKLLTRTWLIQAANGPYERGVDEPIDAG